MTKEEALTLEALKYAVRAGYGSLVREMKFSPFIIRGGEALAQPEQESVAVYGYCPKCGAKGVQRERRPDGNDKCVNGHTYPSSKTTPPKRPWRPLTEEEKDSLLLPFGSYGEMEAIEAMLKEKNFD